MFLAGGTTAPDEPLAGCSFGFSGLVCVYPTPSYDIRLPWVLSADAEIPVVVIFHDAGGTGADILDDPAIVDEFLDSGYAVLTPDAALRRNRRLLFDGARPTGPSVTQVYPIRFSERDFPVEGPDGTVSDLRWGETTGWYFHSTDVIRYTKQDLRMGDESDSDYIGRDELAVLRRILAHAAESHGTRPKPAMVAGVGHGASLVWQIACHAPELADLFAPIGATFWKESPDDCRPGARLVHTHRRANEFWPLEGVRGNKRRYARTSIHDNIAMLLGTNGCDRRATAEGTDAQGFAFKTWDRCRNDGSVELLLTDERKKVPDGWAAAMLARLVSPLLERADELLQAPPPVDPVFRSAGERPDEAAAGAPRFLRPGVKRAP